MFAKSPVPGAVKTRLCPPCTPEQAAAVAEAALADTLAAARRSSAERVVIVLDGEPGAWLPPGVSVVRQSAGTFSARLAAAWAETRGPAVQIGMDTPQVDAAELDSLMATVLDGGRQRAVLGPAADGGWWALGMRTPRSDVFDVPSSRPDTGARQVQRLVDAGFDVRLAHEHRDVDTWADALAVAEAVTGGAFAESVAAVLQAR